MPQDLYSQMDRAIGLQDTDHPLRPDLRTTRVVDITDVCRGNRFKSKLLKYAKSTRGTIVMVSEHHDGDLITCRSVSYYLDTLMSPGALVECLDELERFACGIGLTGPELLELIDVYRPEHQRVIEVA